MVALSTTRDELSWFVQASRAPRLKSVHEWVESSIVIPDGPFAGLRFKADRQPYTRLLFSEMDSGRWNRAVITGPTQSGKTFSAFIVPTLYHLFEVGESVICGVPSGEIVKDKWEVDLKPAIESSQYRDLLPRRGAGSKGGTPTSIRFLNGATLRFMTGGGSDKKRSAFTSRVVVITETDGMDEAGQSSREADKLTQLEARTRAFGNRKRIYMECTVSIDTGRTWTEFQAGTCSRIILPCPHCGDWVTPEREHLHGWQDAENVIDARANGYLQCPSCSHPWTEQERRAANQQCRLLHRGQEVTPDGEIVGPLPKTDTLGFRWTAANNLFVSSGDIAADEWTASRSENQENAEKELRQFVWALPHEPDVIESVSLDTRTLITRVNTLQRGYVAPWVKWLTVGIDVGKYFLHWVLTGCNEQGTGQEIDYGIVEVNSNHLPVDVAVLAALRSFRDTISNGWPRINGAQVGVDKILCDSRYQTDAVNTWCRESGDRFHPTMGYGGTANGFYSRPRQTGNLIRVIGDGYHVLIVRETGNDPVKRVDIDANIWKTALHDRLSCPVSSAGAITLHAAEGLDHLQFAKHVTAERKIEEWIAGKGQVIRWEAIRKDNHWLDAFSLSLVGQHMCGARVTKPSEYIATTGKKEQKSHTWFSQQKRK